MSDYQSFVKDGYFNLGKIISDEQCQNLLKQVQKAHEFSPSMFLTEEAHRANPPKSGTNPGPGYNLVEKIDIKFIEQDKTFAKAMTEILGEGYRLELVKFIMGVPQSWVPKWVDATGTHNLNSFLKEDYRDISYFYGANYHQDVVDFSGPKALKSKSFITLYVYLDKVEAVHAPIFLLPGSHKFGATAYPHKIKTLSDSAVIYADDQGRSEEFECKMITGDAGTVAFWHSLVLHKTTKITDVRPRISLKYVFEKTTTKYTLIDELDDTCDGPLVLEKHRTDMTEKQVKDYFSRVPAKSA